MSATPFENSGLQWSKVEPALRPLVGSLSPRLISSLQSLLEVVELPGGDHLFQQGDAGDAMFIVISGRLKVLVTTDGQVRELAELGRGESIGEMALLSGEARNAGIVAIRDCQLLRISKEAFEQFVEQAPAIGLNLGRLLVARFTQTAKRKRHRLATAALLPLHPGIEVGVLAENIRNVLQTGKTVACIDSRVVDQALGAGIAQTPFDNKADSNRLTSWLDQQESTHDLLLYIADSKVTEWTKRCMRQADELLLLADAREAPEQTSMEAALFGATDPAYATRQTLVLVHPASLLQPSGSASWLKNRPQVRAHWHLRQDKLPADIGRLARYLSGDSTGLVLSGGGAKGFAHIGVWRALKEAGIDIDYIGATSMGAFIGGIIALDADYQEVERVCRQVAMSRPSSDFHLFPIVSLLKGKILDRVLSEHYSPYDMEDCILPFFCMSSNLTHAQPVVHRRGNMFKAIRASGSLPGIVPPVVLDNCLLVDGGVFNNFPVDVMAEMGVGRIIGVDFMTEEENALDFEDMPSNWQVIRRRWLSRKPSYKVPSMINTIMETTTLFSTYKHKQSRALTDVYINPDVSRFGLMEWSAFDAIVEAGYRAANEVLEKLK